MHTLQLGMGWFPEEAGGLNRFYYNCVHNLPNVGISTSGLVAGSPTVDQHTHGQVRAFAPAQSPLWYRYFKLRQLIGAYLKECNPSVIASHFALYTFPILDKIRDCPLVIHFHGPWALESDVEVNRQFATKVKRTIETLVYQQGHSFIVLSQAFQQTLHQVYQVPLEKIHIVPGSVDMAHFHSNQSLAAARTALNWPHDRPIILAVRRLSRRMGLENLITAIDKVRYYQPDVLLLIAGQGELMPSLRQQIKDLDLSKNVQLLGFVPDEKLPIAYRAANFSVVPTVALEGFGLIVLESLASGTPVLGTPVGGIPEILSRFSKDLLFDGSTSDQLATGILEALSGDRRLPDQAACRSFVQQHYTWPVISQQIKTVYQAVLDGRAV